MKFSSSIVVALFGSAIASPIIEQRQTTPLSAIGAALNTLQGAITADDSAISKFLLYVTFNSV
jgi:hypothetical protein